MDLHNKTILITGASSGIGRAVAVALSHNNNTLILTARRQGLLEELAEEVRANGSEALVFAGDATDPDHAPKVVDAIVDAYGRIDIALLNVGIGPPSNALTATAETIRHCMRVNYDSMINFFVPLIHQMKTQQSHALIAHMNSQASYFGIPMQGDYTAAKAAARIFLDTACMELQHFGIKHIAIQTIHPGFVDTEACKDDGIPETHLISEEQAASYVLRGLEKEQRENLFPPAMKWATRLGRILPHWLLTRILLASVPKSY